MLSTRALRPRTSSNTTYSPAQRRQYVRRAGAVATSPPVGLPWFPWELSRKFQCGKAAMTVRERRGVAMVHTRTPETAKSEQPAEEHLTVDWGIHHTYIISYVVQHTTEGMGRGRTA